MSDAAARTPIAVVADDYAIAPGVSAGIRELVDAGRLTGVSCMTHTAVWEAEGPTLRGADVDVGLHFVLTAGAPTGPMPRAAPDGRLPDMAGWLRRACLGQVDRAEVEAELNRQIDRFEDVFGAPPAHVDGHQHVHQLPGVRDAVLAVMRGRLGGRAWLRSTAESPWTILRRGVAVPKALALATAAAALQLRAGDLPKNRGFSGLYGFDLDVPFGERFSRFIRYARPGTLVMTHPGYVDAALEAADPVTASREAELRWLASDALPEALEREGVTLARLSACLAS